MENFIRMSQFLFGCEDVKDEEGFRGQMLWFVSQSLSDSDSNPMMDGV